MGAIREKLPNRRFAETRDIQVGGLKGRATVGRFSDGRLAEVFVDLSKVGSAADIAARDSAICASLYFQMGGDPEVLRRALCRDARGRASSSLAVVLDQLAQEAAT